jgi:hypothetical protein
MNIIQYFQVVVNILAVQVFYKFLFYFNENWAQIFCVFSLQLLIFSFMNPKILKIQIIILIWSNFEYFS